MVSGADETGSSSARRQAGCCPSRARPASPPWARLVWLCTTPALARFSRAAAGGRLDPASDPRPHRHRRRALHPLFHHPLSADFPGPGRRPGKRARTGRPPPGPCWPPAWAEYAWLDAGLGRTTWPPGARLPPTIWRWLRPQGRRRRLCPPRQRRLRGPGEDGARRLRFSRMSPTRAECRPNTFSCSSRAPAGAAPRRAGQAAAPLFPDRFAPLHPDTGPDRPEQKPQPPRVRAADDLCAAAALARSAYFP